LVEGCYFLRECKADQLREAVDATEDGHAIHAKLLRLHAMANTVINGAGMTVPAGSQSLSGLASEISTDILNAITVLQTCLSLVLPIENLAPKHSTTAGFTFLGIGKINHEGFS
jgi:hypothetical protein